MANRRGAGPITLLATAGLAVAGFYATVRFDGQLASISLFVMAFGIVLFFLALLGRVVQ